MKDDWPCEWEDCSETFYSESGLFDHVKSHTQLALILRCEWRECSSTTVYTHRGHLKDHVISHMSDSFVSVWCVCGGAFRNRQALFRHQRKTECRAINLEDDPLSPIEPGSPKGQFPIFPMDEELAEDQATFIEPLLDNYLSILADGVKGISLNDIVNEERKGTIYFCFIHFKICEEWMPGVNTALIPSRLFKKLPIYQNN
jgi:hypothetical protein